MTVEEADSRLRGEPEELAQTRVAVDEGRLQRTLGDAGVGIALVDRRGRYLDMNGCFCDLVGYSKGELLGLRFQDLLSPDDAASAMGLRRLLAGEITAYRQEQRFLHSGTRFGSCSAHLQ